MKIKMPRVTLVLMMIFLDFCDVDDVLLMSKMMAIMVIIIISMTPQAQWKEECHKLRWLKEQYLLLYYQVEIFTVDHFLRR